MITTHIDLSLYQPPPEDEEGLTALQVAERRHSTRRASLLRYDLEMTEERARLLLAKTTREIMAELDLDADRAGDVAHLARIHLERGKLARAEIGAYCGE